jgi:hypothetical protein
MPIPCRVLGFALLLTATASGQDIRSPEPLVRIDAYGPQALRRAFLPTNIGTLCASEDGERVWRPLLQPLEQMWRSLDNGPEFDQARQRALDYAGRMHLLWMRAPGSNDEEESFVGVFAMQTHERSDMPAMAQDLTRPLAVLGQEPQMLEVQNGTHLQVLHLEDGQFITLPMVTADHVLVFFGEPAALTAGGIPRCLLALDAADPELDCPLRIQIDLSQARSTPRWRERPEVRALFGIDSIETMTVRVRPNGPHFEIAADLEFNNADRGILEALFPPQQTTPQLLSRVPRGTNPWFVGPLRLDVLMRRILELIPIIDEQGNRTPEEIRAEMHKELGLHLDTDLFDHFGEEVMLLGDFWEDVDNEAWRNGEDPPIGACMVFSLRNTEAFQTGMNKLLELFKGAVRTVDERTVEGVRITRLGSAFVTGVHLAAGNGMFAIAFGSEGTKQLELVVTAAHANDVFALPTPLEHVMHLSPPGRNGLGLLNVSALLRGQLALTLEAIEEVLPPMLGVELAMDETQEALDAAAPLIERHGLNHIVVLQGHADNTWRLRVVW